MDKAQAQQGKAALCACLSHIHSHWLLKVGIRCDMHSLLKKVKGQARALLYRTGVGLDKGRDTQGGGREKMQPRMKPLAHQAQHSAL